MYIEKQFDLYVAIPKWNHDAPIYCNYYLFNLPMNAIKNSELKTKTKLSLVWVYWETLPAYNVVWYLATQGS